MIVYYSSHTILYNLKILIAFFTAILILSSCSDQSSIVVEDEEMMVNVLIDMYIADVALTKHSTVLRDSMREVYRDQILKIYDLESNSYDSLYSLVQRDFEQMDSIQVKVLKRLREINKEAESKTK